MPGINIAIVDYGLGNIFSIQRAIGSLGFDSSCTADAKEILKADRLILPGVGAFGDGMKELKAHGLDQILKEYAKTGKPILGICLGMQLLLTTSEEFGLNDGLNLIPGHVRKIPSPQPTGPQFKLPHVGWSRIQPYGGDASSWKSTILENNQPGDFFYFVHSFRAIPDENEHILAETEYGHTNFCSVVGRDNIFGCQFHPELSGKAGLEIFRKFIEIHLEARSNLSA